MVVIRVNALPGYKLEVEYDDGVSGVIDLKAFVQNGIFKALQNESYFNKVYTNGYSIAWNEELEIDAWYIYAEVLNKKPEDIIEANFKYATN